MLQLSKQEREIIQNVFRQFPGHSAEVFLFGSRANGTAKKYSDVDLLIKAKTEFSSFEKSQIRSLFEESNSALFYDIVFDEDLFEPYRKEVELQKRPLLTTD